MGLYPTVWEERMTRTRGWQGLLGVGDLHPGVVLESRWQEKG